MRIIGGKYKSRRIKVPAGLKVRPTADRVRESLFNILGGQFEGISVLDLFAGSGALGLEALSRGAETAAFVDNSPASLAIIKENIESLELEDYCRTVFANLEKGVGALTHKADGFNLIFLDPPYSKGLINTCLTLIDKASLISPGATAVAESATSEDLPKELGSWILTDQRIYGQTKLSFYEYSKK